MSHVGAYAGALSPALALRRDLRPDFASAAPEPRLKWLGLGANRFTVQNAFRLRDPLVAEGRYSRLACSGFARFSSPFCVGFPDPVVHGLQFFHRYPALARVTSRLPSSYAGKTLLDDVCNRLTR